jgi:hypothetical protein
MPQELSAPGFQWFYACSTAPVDKCSCEQVYIKCVLTFRSLTTYMSYRSANLQTLHFKYLFNKYTY